MTLIAPTFEYPQHSYGVPKPLKGGQTPWTEVWLATSATYVVLTFPGESSTTEREKGVKL